MTEAAGVPVDGANRRDLKMARETVEAIATDRLPVVPGKPQGLCLDRDYDYGEVRAVRLALQR